MMLQPCWEDEFVVATFSTYMFGHTSSPCAIPIRTRCLRPQLSLCRNPSVRTAWQIHPLGVTGVTARHLPARCWSCAREHPAPLSLMEHPEPCGPQMQSQT